MVNVYLPNEITLELLTMAANENEGKKKGEKQTTDATIIGRIVREWYKTQMEAIEQYQYKTA